MTRSRKQAVLSVTCANLIAVLGFTFALSNCGTPSQPHSIAGTWAGTVTDNSGHQGTASLGLTDDRHDILQGVFSYAASDCSSSSNSVTGKISGGELSLEQTPPDPVPTTLQLTVDSTDQHLTGSYSNTNASCSSSGTVDLTKPASN